MALFVLGAGAAEGR